MLHISKRYFQLEKKNITMKGSKMKKIVENFFKPKKGEIRHKKGPQFVEQKKLFKKCG